MFVGCLDSWFLGFLPGRALLGFRFRVFPRFLDFPGFDCFGGFVSGLVVLFVGYLFGCIGATISSDVVCVLFYIWILEFVVLICLGGLLVILFVLPLRLLLAVLLIKVACG